MRFGIGPAGAPSAGNRKRRFARRVLFLGGLLALGCPAGPLAGQTSRRADVEIARIEQMPRSPAPYHLRDWARVSRDYIHLALDPHRRGEFLPLVRFPEAASGGFDLPSYVGLKGAEGINCLAAGVSGGLAGIDMTRIAGRNWVALCQAFFNREDGVYTNGVGERAGGTFWYDIFPNILAYQLAALYPPAEKERAPLRQAANQWYRACVAMGGKTDPDTLPDFDHTAFRFATMTPVDNGAWIEPDAAAGIAWLEIMAWTRFHDPRYLTATDWCLRALERRPAEKNPLYEVLLPYGALAAARMNAERDRDYNVHKLFDWCFQAGGRAAARWGWGILADRCGEYDCAGLVGSVIDTDGYAFTMNTFEWAGALTPVARYDPRYARAIGRWMLNLANAARLFYPNALPAAHQDDRAWSERYDSDGCIAYEGLRKQALRYCFAASEETPRQGRIASGSVAQTRRWDDQEEILEETEQGGQTRLEHLWRLTLPAGTHYELFARACMGAGAAAGKAFRFSCAKEPAGPYREAFTVTSTDRQTYGAEIQAGAGPLYVKVESAGKGAGAASIGVDLLRAGVLNPALSPYATGDAVGTGNPSNLCLYGSSHVGILGALVQATNVEKILRLDLLKTDYYHSPAYPTYLYYNPYETSQTIVVETGPEPKDLYEAVRHRFLMRNVRNEARLTLPADSALVVVVAPAKGREEMQGHRRRIDGVVVDYHCE